MTCNLLKARQKSSVKGAIGCGFDSHWLKEILSQSLSVAIAKVTFDSHLKTAPLSLYWLDINQS